MVSSKTETACDGRTDPLHRPGPFECGGRAKFKEQTQAVPVLQDPADGAPPERHHLVNQAEHRRHLIGPEPVLISDERSSDLISPRASHSDTESRPPRTLDGRSETEDDDTADVAEAAYDAGQLLGVGEMRRNLELAEFVQSALSHRWEPAALRDWQASMQRRCLLHRFPCRLWYEFIYEWQVEPEPADPYPYVSTGTPTVLSPAGTSRAQQTLCEIRVCAAPTILAGHVSVHIHRM
ncbi:unnamed protein product [Symbiodinium sp. CCMP2456]|nr:unnamed protein product [Symbiodinium sp. CCMP2456]